MDRKASFITAVALLSIGSLAGAANVPTEQPEKPKAEDRAAVSPPTTDAAPAADAIKQKAATSDTHSATNGKLTPPVAAPQAKATDKTAPSSEKPAAKPLEKTSSATDPKLGTTPAQDVAKTTGVKPATTGEAAAHAKSTAPSAPSMPESGKAAAAVQPLHPTSGTAAEKPAAGKEKL